MLINILAVAAGGAIGAVVRYLNSRVMSHYFASNAHYATLIANVVGCFLMGVAYVWFTNKYQSSETMRLFIMMGFLGALTTWSTFSMETVLMLNAGEIIKGFAYLLATFTLCFSAFYLGMKLSFTS